MYIPWTRRADDPHPFGEALALRVQNAGPSDALGSMGTESMGGGHRRPPASRSGTGSRKGDGWIMPEKFGAGIKQVKRKFVPAGKTLPSPLAGEGA